MTIVRAVEMPQTDAVPELRIEPLSAAIGAEIHGVDLAQNIDDGLFDAIHTALMAYQVVFFREQTITAGQQLALATRFGEPAYSKKLKMYDGYDNVSLLENDGSKIVVGAVWHTDNTDYETPPWGSLLFAEVIPAMMALGKFQGGMTTPIPSGMYCNCSCSGGLGTRVPLLSAIRIICRA